MLERISAQVFGMERDFSGFLKLHRGEVDHLVNDSDPYLNPQLMHRLLAIFQYRNYGFDRCEQLVLNDLKAFAKVGISNECVDRLIRSLVREQEPQLIARFFERALTTVQQNEALTARVQALSCQLSHTPAPTTASVPTQKDASLRDLKPSQDHQIEMPRISNEPRVSLGWTYSQEPAAEPSLTP
jgi:hypothetical protein